MANTNQRKAEIFPMMESAATVTGYFAWQLNSESVNVSFGRILAPAVSAIKTKPYTREK